MNGKEESVRVFLFEIFSLTSLLKKTLPAVSTFPFPFPLFLFRNHAALPRRRLCAHRHGCPPGRRIPGPSKRKSGGEERRVGGGVLLLAAVEATAEAASDRDCEQRLFNYAP